MIPQEIRDQYPFKDEYEQLQSLAREYKYRDIKFVTQHCLNPKKMLAENAIIYLGRISHKSKFLFSGFIDTIRAQNSAVLFLTLRAHFETTAALGFFLYNLKKYYSGELSFDDITFLLYRLSAGSKDSSYIKAKPSIPESVNVLNMIDACDKLLPSEIEDVKKGEKLFSDNYSELSEACHPNSIGLVFGLVAAKGNRFLFSENPSLGTRHQFLYLINKMIGSCSFYFLFYDKCLELLKSNEQMPRVLK